MQAETLEAKNELERKLLAAINGELAAEEFMRELLTQQIFIPIKDDRDSGIQGLQLTNKATPLVVEDEAGGKIVVLFTSPERAKDFLADVPGYSGGLLAEFSWVVERMEPGFAIAVNPGIELGMDIEPEQVMEMLAILASREKSN
ncbi:SseB family protein [Sulfuricystis multivorans]|uniref:SseB family protein n=1 Tax=Sulfuricystis multivorans TaxID=2211108 RepID=UPI000F816E3C|nr:SseB family protein [Sulfuricystis multivorans]